MPVVDPLALLITLSPHFTLQRVLVWILKSSAALALMSRGARWPQMPAGHARPCRLSRRKWHLGCTEGRGMASREWEHPWAELALHPLLLKGTHSGPRPGATAPAGSSSTPGAVDLDSQPTSTCLAFFTCKTARKLWHAKGLVRKRGNPCKWFGEWPSVRAMVGGWVFSGGLYSTPSPVDTDSASPCHPFLRSEAAGAHGTQENLL